MGSVTKQNCDIGGRSGGQGGLVGLESSTQVMLGWCCDHSAKHFHIAEFSEIFEHRRQEVGIAVGEGGGRSVKPLGLENREYTIFLLVHRVQRAKVPAGRN